MAVRAIRRGLGWPRLLEHDIEAPGLDAAHDGIRIAHVTEDTSK